MCMGGSVWVCGRVAGSIEWLYPTGVQIGDHTMCRKSMVFICSRRYESEGLRDSLGWLRRWWRPEENLEWSGSQICAVMSWRHWQGSVGWGFWCRFSGVNGSAEMWVVPSNWAVGAGSWEFPMQVLANWIGR